MDREFWASFSHDPRDAQYQSMRASDLDRGTIQQALTEAYADGRLDREEFDERSEQAIRSRTLGELSRHEPAEKKGLLDRVRSLLDG